VSRLEELGWNVFFTSHWTEIEASLRENGGPACSPARVVEELRDAWRLSAEAGEFLAVVSGRFRHRAEARHELPAAGDWVAAELRPAKERATIHRVLPRRTKLSRQAAGRETSEQILAANVDTICLVQSLDREPNPRLLERAIAMAWESGGSPVVLLTKCDLADDVEARVSEVESVSVGVPVHAVSAVSGAGLEALAPYLHPGRTIVLVGSSGAGKSTLVNRLAGEAVQHVQEVRAADARGRHTTTSRHLIVLHGGALILDTPGIRELQLWDAGLGLEQAFDDIASFGSSCRFRDCSHESEPGCAVRGAVEEGGLDLARLESYYKLQREMRYLARKQDTLLRLAENKKWKAIHKAQRHHKPR
jgi:ribosome biogenesis GTPase